MTRKSQKSVFLQVETLEGRDMPSTIPAPIHSPLQAEWPPPPAMQMSALSIDSEISVSHGKQLTAVWPPPPPNAFVKDGAMELMEGARSRGEEIPQG